MQPAVAYAGQFLNSLESMKICVDTFFPYCRGSYSKGEQMVMLSGGGRVFPSYFWQNLDFFHVKKYWLIMAHNALSENLGHFGSLK